MASLGPWLRKGLLAPVKALLPKNPWVRALLYVLPVVLLLALFGPALDVVLKVFDLGLRVLEPLLQTTVGRVVLILGLAAVIATLGFLLLRKRVRDWRAHAALGRHLGAIADLVGADRRSSREQLRRVARYRGPVPDDYPHLVQDARIKLARLALADDDVDASLGWLTRVVEPGLPSELHRSLLQLRLEALRRQGAVLPATLRREAVEASKRFPGDPAILAVLRDLSLDERDPDAALEWQAKLFERSAPSRHPQEQQRLLELLIDAGDRALQAADHDRARKLAKRIQKLAPDGDAGVLLQGDIHRALGEHRRAVKLYGSARSPKGLDRIAELLSEHPGAVEPRELLASCPTQGALLLVARELARAGDTARAARAAKLAGERLGATPTVCAVLAEVLELLGERGNAQQLRERTARLLLTRPGHASIEPVDRPSTSPS
ncbi:MAG: hypothetical protein ACON4Z_03700 [Planctomycetota bacterium]